MTQKNFKTIKNASYETLLETTLWNQLTDFQKTKILMQNCRLADQKEFEKEFESFEQPSTETIKHFK